MEPYSRTPAKELAPPPLLYLADPALSQAGMTYWREREGRKILFMDVL